MHYCRNLKFDEKPDYEILRKYLQDISERMNYEHDYYYDWILKNSSMSKRMSKCNIPIPPKVRLDGEPSTSDDNKPTDDSKKLTSRMDMLANSKNDLVAVSNSNPKFKNVSVDPPIVRRETYNGGNPYPTLSNSYNNTKYGFVNPINGLTHQDFNPKTNRKDMPATSLMAATGMISTEGPTKYTKYNSRMGESAMNFGVENQFRQTSNAYTGLGVPVLK
jgi:hypothetical protein